MPSLGPVLECEPYSGRSGDRVRLRTIVQGIDLRNTQRFWFQVPPTSSSGFGLTVLGFLAQFRVIDDHTLDVTVPNVGDPAQGQLAPGPYVLVAHGGWYVAHTAGVFTVLAGAAAQPSPSPASASSPSVPIPRALVRSPILLPPSPGLTPPSGPSPGGSTAAPPAPSIAPTIRISTPVRMPVSFNPPGIPPSAPRAAPPSAAPPASMPDARVPSGDDPARLIAPPPDDEPPPYEEYVRWLVEEAWPVFDAEDLVGYRAAVSATCLRYPAIPIKREPARLEMAPHPSSRSGRVLGSGSRLAELERPNGRDNAVTNSDGQVFFLLDLPVLENREIFSEDEKLHPLRLVLGEDEEEDEEEDGGGGDEAAEGIEISTSAGMLAPPPFPPPGMSAPSTMIAARAPGGDEEPGWTERILDIFVPEGARPILTAIEYAGARRLAESGITAVKGEVVKRFLTEIAQHLRRTYPIAGILAAAQVVTLTEDEENALYIGAFLGAARGVWVAGRDTVTDFYDTIALGVTILHKVFTFVSDDPLFALKLLGSLAIPGAGPVTYRLDAGFRARIDRYILGFARQATLFASMMAQIAVAAWENRDVLYHTVATAIFQSFDREFGYIATDYMGYAPDGMERAYFIAAFMAADVGAYIGTVIGIEVLIAIATAGVGSYISALAKAGRLRRIEPILRVLRRVYGTIEGIGEAFHKKAAKAFIAIIHFLGDIPRRYIGKILDVVEDRLERVATMFLRFSEDAGERIKALVAAVNAVAPSPEGLARYLKMIVNWADGVSYRNAERIWPDGPGFAPVCRRA